MIDSPGAKAKNPAFSLPVLRTRILRAAALRHLHVPVSVRERVLRDAILQAGVLPDYGGLDAILLAGVRDAVPVAAPGAAIGSGAGRAGDSRSPVHRRFSVLRPIQPIPERAPFVPRPLREIPRPAAHHPLPRRAKGQDVVEAAVPGAAVRGAVDKRVSAPGEAVQLARLRRRYLHANVLLAEAWPERRRAPVRCPVARRHGPDANCVLDRHGDLVGDWLNVSLARADSIPADVHQACLK